MAHWQGMANKQKIKGIVVYPNRQRANMVLQSLTGSKCCWCNSTRWHGIGQLHVWHNGHAVNVYYVTKPNAGMLKPWYVGKHIQHTQLVYVQ